MTDICPLTREQAAALVRHLRAHTFGYNDDAQLASAAVSVLMDWTASVDAVRAPTREAVCEPCGGGTERPKLGGAA